MSFVSVPDAQEFSALAARVAALEAEVFPPEPPPEPEPPPVLQDLHLWVQNTDGQGISGCVITSPGQAPRTTSGDGHTHFHVTGPAVYHFDAGGYVPKDQTCVPGEPPVILDRVPVVPPPTGTFIQPLNGWLRRGANATFADDSGLRSVRGCSYFPLVRVMHDKPDFAREQLDKMIGRYQLVRVFWHLAHPDAWIPMNSSVSPLTDSWFDEAFVKTLQECWDRGLRVNLTSGDHAIESPRGTWKRVLPADQVPGLYRRVAGLCKSVNEQVVALDEAINEARMNSLEHEDWSHWAGLSREFQSIYPWGHHCTSDPGGQEEPADLRAAAIAPSTCVSIHGTRISSIDSIRRAFNLRYEGVGDIPIAETEPNGIDTGDQPGVYQGTTNRSHIFGLYAAKILTGQLLIHFDSAGLGWHHYPIDREWGFHELPARWQAMGIPEDIGTWALIPGHRAEAPITIEGIPSNSSARSDNVVAPDGSRGFNLTYGQTLIDPSRWRIVARQACRGRLWTAEGDPQDFVTSGGRFADEPTSKQVIVVEWHR